MSLEKDTGSRSRKTTWQKEQWPILPTLCALVDTTAPDQRLVSASSPLPSDSLLLTSADAS